MPHILAQACLLDATNAIVTSCTYKKIATGKGYFKHQYQTSECLGADLDLNRLALSVFMKEIFFFKKS